MRGRVSLDYGVSSPRRVRKFWPSLSTTDRHDFTPDVVRVLSRYEVPATFFVLGERAASMSKVVRSVAEAGHGIGIHGWTHTAFSELDSGVFAADLCRTSELLQKLTGKECRSIRPPYGRYDGELVSVLADRQLVTWLWTADAGDWSVDASADQIAGKVLRSLTPGGIVLLHDGGWKLLGNGARTAKDHRGCFGARVPFRHLGRNASDSPVGACVGLRSPALHMQP